MKDLKTIIISSFCIIEIAFPQWSTNPASPQSLGSGIQAQLAPTPDGGCYVAWLGDGNNIVYSLIEAAVQFNFKLAIACPEKLRPNEKIVKWAKNKGADILITKNPKEAAINASAVITDKWISMSDKVKKKKKKKLLKHYQVNKKILGLAKKDAIFMHCLPASRGEEVTDEIMDGKQSAVWLEALNRVYVQQSIIEWCLR